MIRIGVFGDTHGYTALAARSLASLGALDLILHTGDHYADARKIAHEMKQEILAVTGNCDPHAFGPKERVINVGEKKIYLTHGHLYGVKKGVLNLFYRGQEVEADLVVFGHTHRAVQEEVEGMMFLNPGSPSFPRDRQKTIALVTIAEGKIKTYIINISDDIAQSD